MKILKNLAVYLFIILLAVMVLRWLNPPAPQTPALDYNSFKQSVSAGEVQEVEITTTASTMNYKVTMKNGAKYDVVGPGYDQQLLDDMAAQKGLKVVYQPPVTIPWWVSVAPSLIMVALLFGLMYFVMQQSQGGGGGRVMQFGRSRARLVTDDKKVTFADVAGADEVKEELAEIVEFLKTPRKFNELGAKIPTGVLLFGPPGTGKTLLAKAVSGEAGVPFFSISGSDFVEMFVGVGASRVRDLFEQAKKSSPCIVFIDEIDAVGRHRGAGLGGGHDEREQTLNQLLVEMDGFNGKEGIIIIAATNRPDILDPALLRPGRFDRQVVVDSPDVKGREEILGVHSKGKPLADDVKLSVLARGTPGFTGADLANLVNEAALLSARWGSKRISMKALEESIERVIAGPEKKSRVISDYEKKLVSFHEAGHALVAEYLTHSDPVHKVSIIPRGMAGGYTLLLPKEDRQYRTRSQLLDNVTVLLGGRVAEALALKEVSTGASNDLERATDTIRRMVTEWGMSDEIGPVTVGHKKEEVFLGRDIARDRNYSESVAQTIDREIRRLVDDCYSRAEQIVTEKMEILEAIAGALMEKETLPAREFREIVDSFDAEKAEEHAALEAKEKALREELAAKETAAAAARAAGEAARAAKEDRERQEQQEQQEQRERDPALQNATAGEGAGD
ncbi:MAG: ATP-dependent zinc metalloprotease FtsH [Gracilibacteraceae bacterium]|nr:ATP-dependent zinc metalloprotease FtsH [Gracilibacteraceae bacterium]